MSTTINIENAKQIRKPMELYCSFSATNDSNTLTTTPAGNISIKDSNLSTTVADPKIPMRILTDLANGGFPLDGTAEFYDSTVPANEENGKIGLRTTVNGTVTMTVSATNKINALTIAITGGTGTISCNGKTYTARRTTIVPVDSKTTTLTFTANDDTRLHIASIKDAITLNFDADNIISCCVSLRSNLDIINPTWEVSDIELNAYCVDDISSVIGNVGDDVPLTYYAGYEGDYSTTRTFYLSEKATIKDNVLTLKAEDISAKLEDYTVKSGVVLWHEQTSLSSLYNKMYNVINSALGGKYPITKQKAPAKQSGTNNNCGLIFKEQTAKDFISNVMNIGHKTINNVNFYPVFVDAGIPTLRWSKPTAKWDIYEEDCGEISFDYDRNINRIKSDGDYYIDNKVTVSSKTTKLQDTTVKAGKLYTYNYEDYVYNPTVTNATVIRTNLDEMVFKAKKSTTSKKIKKFIDGKAKTKTVYSNYSTIKGRIATVSNIYKSRTRNRAGVTQTLSPNVYGQLKCNGEVLYPDWSNLFNISNCTGSFTFKGDPRMQPRDVFNFHRLNGAVEQYTFETITLNHDGGGLSADVTFRKGVV